MKTLALILCATFCAAVGDAFLSRGMKAFGDVSAFGFSQPWKILGMFQQPLVVIGVTCAAGYFFLYTSVLSWADLSATQPLTATTYVWSSLIAYFVLREPISPRRWTGIALIVAGVALIARDQAANAPSR